MARTEGDLRGHESPRDKVHRARTAVKWLRAVLRLVRARRRGPRRGGWDGVAGGLADTYRWGRRALATAYEQADDAAFHDWYNAVKYHGYHVRLLASMWPVELDGRREALERLAELLGEDHDLTVFAQTLRTEGTCFDGEHEQRVPLGLIAERQRALRAMARPLGRRLYADPPAALIRRLQRLWRGENQPDVAAAVAASKSPPLAAAS